jgi:hypothetical protein
VRACLPMLYGLLALCMAVPAFAEDVPFGSLDFSRLSTSQEGFFWKRLRGLADEEAVLAYCGQADDFTREAKQGIRACVTSQAMDKAESFFNAELKATQVDLRARKASCQTKPRENRGWLGVEMKIGEEKGALVAGAVEGSPAAAAGLKSGDVIGSVNGEAIADPKDLSAKIRALSPGATAQIGITRDGAGRTVSVKLAGMAFDADGRAALDMPALVVSSKQDLKSVADEVTSMCQKCKTTIWALFCR